MYDLADFTEIGDLGLITVNDQTGWGEEAWGDEPWGGGPVTVIVTGGDTEWTEIETP